MKEILLEGIGWVGAIMLLLAYGMLSAKKLSSNSYAYHGLNIGGAALLAVYSAWKDAGAEVLINVIWVGIGLVAVRALRRTPSA